MEKQKTKKWLFLVLAIVLMTVLITGTTYLLLFYKNNYTITFNIPQETKVVLEYGDEWNAPEVTAVRRGTYFDKEDVAQEVAVEGEVDLSKVGTYEVIYRASYIKPITNMEYTAEAKITVVVQDTKAPIIDLVVNPDSFTRPIDPYEEEGYTATDNYDGDVTKLVMSKEENGVVIYSVVDSSGNITVVKRPIVYKDVVSPTITLSGESEITIPFGTDFVEPGFTAQDDCDGDIAHRVTVEGSVDSAAVGEYVLTYTVEDSYKNQAQATRTVRVVDNTAPTLSLSGKGTVYVKVGSSYSEPGYSAADNVDGNLTNQVSVSSNVNTAKTGNYTIYYSVTDTAGNKASVSRSVYVYQKQNIAQPVNPGNKVVYLTFDDGPGPYTAQLLDILDHFGVKATFFVTNQMSNYRHMIGEAYRRGHTIALHTYSHEFSEVYSSEDAYYRDLQKMQDIVIKETGVAASIVRFPGGTANTISRHYCTGIMSTLANGLSYHGYLYCDWNVSAEDTGTAKTADQVADNVIAGIKRRNVSVVLQHDIKKYSVQAVEEILAWGLSNGYTFLPMTESTPMVHQAPKN